MDHLSLWNQYVKRVAEKRTLSVRTLLQMWERKSTGKNNERIEYSVRVRDAQYLNGDVIRTASLQRHSDRGGARIGGAAGLHSCG